MTTFAVAPQVTVSTTPSGPGTEVGQIDGLAIRAIVRPGEHEVSVSDADGRILLVETFTVTGSPNPASWDGWVFSNEAMFLSAAAMLSLFSDGDALHAFCDSGCGEHVSMLNVTDRGWDVWHQDPVTAGLVIRTRTILDPVALRTARM